MIIPNHHSVSSKPIRSYVKRIGRMTSGQKKALSTHWHKYGLQSADYKTQAIAFEHVFANQQPVIMEIGFGMGDSLIAMARAQPTQNYLGIEVHEPGVGSILSKAFDYQLGNLKVFCEDAQDVLDTCIQDHSLAGVQVFFPDPWHKKKHHKRRLIQPLFVQALHQKIIPGGCLHMATDWQPYAEHMLAVMEASHLYTNMAGLGKYSPQPDFRPSTRFQKRGEGKGHGVWDLMYKAV